MVVHRLSLLLAILLASVGFSFATAQEGIPANSGQPGQSGSGFVQAFQDSAAPSVQQSPAPPPRIEGSISPRTVPEFLCDPSMAPGE